MSADDPTEELQILERAIDAPGSRLPPAAARWVAGARKTAEEILETIDGMQSDGKAAPTERQRQALEGIYLAACRWLGRAP